MIKIVLTSVFVSSAISFSYGSVDEEALLRRKAALVAKKVHVKNLNLIGVDPTTCKNTDNSKVLLDHIKNLKSSSLNHCPSAVEKFLKPLQEEIAKVDSGELVYAPQPIQNSARPTPDLPEPSETPEEFYPPEPEEQPLALEVPKSDTLVGPTGLTEGDLDRIFSSYERNPREYRPSEEDNLFKILSKAYVRNLNRLIERPGGN